MFLSELAEYTSQYRGGMKSISFRSASLKIDSDTCDLEVRKTHGNYELFFNKKGFLTHSVHHDEAHDYTMVYGYGDGKMPLAAQKIENETQKLLELTVYYYDKPGRISREENWHFCEGSNWHKNEEALHTYNEISRTTVYPISSPTVTDVAFTNTWHKWRKLGEVKSLGENNTFISWYRNKYSGENLATRTSLDENGIENGRYDYFYRYRLMISCRYQSAKLNYREEYQHTFNEREQWTTKLVLRDGEPTHVYERDIVYY